MGNLFHSGVTPILAPFSSQCAVARKAEIALSGGWFKIGSFAELAEIPWPLAGGTGNGENPKNGGGVSPKFCRGLPLNYLGDVSRSKLQNLEK